MLNLDCNGTPKTQFFTDTNLDSSYNLYLEFDKTMFFADSNLDSRYNLNSVLRRLYF